MHLHNYSSDMFSIKAFVIQTNKIVVRDSNIELLRILSMFLVLIFHADYLSLGVPKQADIMDSCGSALMRSMIESCSVVCVNAFILVSGWYGINGKIYRFLQLVFQALFISISLYAMMRALGLTYEMTISEWIEILLFKHKGYWFVRAYIILYLFAPVLNAFVSNSDRLQLKYFLIGFFVVQCAYGFYNYGGWYAGGYSPLSFVGLYLLARYMRLFPIRFAQFSRNVDISIYLILSVMIAVCSLIFTFFFNKGDTVLMLYSSPLVILSSVFFFLFFTKLSFRSTFVNWVAASSFSVYLVHTSPSIYRPYFVNVIRNWFDMESSGFFILYTSVLIIALYVFSIIYDQIRICIWNFLNLTIGIKVNS